MSAQTSIEVKHAAATIRALRDMEPDLRKRLNKTIRAALSWTVDGARSRYPEGSWIIRINNKSLLGSISARAGTRANQFGKSDPGVRAAVFEFAGKYQPGRTPQARAMIASLNARYGQPGRFLWDSWDATKDTVLDTIRDAVYQVERELQARLDAAGESY